MPPNCPHWDSELSSERFNSMPAFDLYHFFFSTFTEHGVVLSPPTASPQGRTKEMYVPKPWELLQSSILEALETDGGFLEKSLGHLIQ